MIQMSFENIDVPPYGGKKRRFLRLSNSILFTAIFITLIIFSSYLIIPKSNIGTSLISCAPLRVGTSRDETSNYKIVAVLTSICLCFVAALMFFKMHTFFYVIFLLFVYACMVFSISGSLLSVISYTFFIIDYTEKGYGVVCPPPMPFSSSAFDNAKKYHGGIADHVYLISSPSRLNPIIFSDECVNISTPIDLQKFCPTNFEQILTSSFYDSNSTLSSCRLLGGSPLYSPILNLCIDKQKSYYMVKFIFFVFLIFIFICGLFRYLVVSASYYHYASLDTNELSFFSF
jgi:hypothetical protein